MIVLGFFGGGKLFLIWVRNEQEPQGKRALTSHAHIVERTHGRFFEDR